jgi:hypothetical protein
VGTKTVEEPCWVLQRRKDQNIWKGLQVMQKLIKEKKRVVQALSSEELEFRSGTCDSPSLANSVG